MLFSLVFVMHVIPAIISMTLPEILNVELYLWVDASFDLLMP